MRLSQSLLLPDQLDHGGDDREDHAPDRAQDEDPVLRTGHHAWHISPACLFVLGGGSPEDQCGFPQGRRHDECGESETRGGGALTQQAHLRLGGPQIDAFGA